MSQNDQDKYTGYEAIQAAAAYIKDQLGEADDVASVGVVLGSGLGSVADEVMTQEGSKAIEYGTIPHFPTSSVVGHKGRLVYGNLNGKAVLLMQGRVHAYEGYSPRQVVFPVRVLMALGVKRLILTNAAGGITPGMQPGTLMLLSDHLNLTAQNPLTGKNDDRLGPRFPDMSFTYHPDLKAMAYDVAKEQGCELMEGVYAGLLGPSYETPAEIKMLQTLGANAVGMSTVFEAIAAGHQGTQVLGMSCITNLAAGISDQELSHEEVAETAKRVEHTFSALVLELVSRF
jgi:purine-nucleoside phosphorylase